MQLLLPTLPGCLFTDDHECTTNHATPAPQHAPGHVSQQPKRKQKWNCKTTPKSKDETETVKLDTAIVSILDSQLARNTKIQNCPVAANSSPKQKKKKRINRRCSATLEAQTGNQKTKKKKQTHANICSRVCCPGLSR